MKITQIRKRYKEIEKEIKGINYESRDKAMGFMYKLQEEMGKKELEKEHEELRLKIIEYEKDKKYIYQYFVNGGYVAKTKRVLKENGKFKIIINPSYSYTPVFSKEEKVSANFEILEYLGEKGKSENYKSYGEFEYNRKNRKEILKKVEDKFKALSNSSPLIQTSDRKSNTKVEFNTDLKEVQK
jgi:hypothetical protein